MTRSRILALSGAALVAVAGAVIALTGAPPASAAQNLLVNPGFEAGSLTGWSCEKASVVNTGAHSGGYALSGAADEASTAQCGQTVAVVPNSAYTLSAWVKGAYVFLGVTGSASTWTPAATDWTKLSVSFTTAATTSSVEVYLHGWYGQGSYQADDVVLDGAAGPTGPASPTPSTPGTPAPTTAAPTTPAPTTAAPTTPAPTTAAPTTPPPAGGQHAWPYLDVTMSAPTMASVATATGQQYFTAAFVIGSSAGCVPSWGGTIPLEEARIKSDIAAIKARGGDVAIAFGGAVGPYLEHVCSSQAQLAAAYESVIDKLGVSHLDIDIEASVNVDMMNKALAQVQRERPGTQISFTLMVQGDDYGLTPTLGYDLLANAKSNGVSVALVNPMTMEFGSSRADWGDAVIAAANATLGQMAQLWPEKTDAQRRRMLSVTPMIGRNFNGRIFQIEDANQLVTWANGADIGGLAFWSVGRDNGGCAGGGVSATCSSISQSTYQFTGIFKGFTG